MASISRLSFVSRASSHRAVVLALDRQRIEAAVRNNPSQHDANLALD